MDNVIYIKFDNNEFTARPLKSVHVEYTTKKKQPRFFDMMFQRDVREVIDGLLCDYADEDAFMAMAGCSEVERDFKVAEYREKIIEILENKDA